jgi:hypothetical protein
MNLTGSRANSSSPTLGELLALPAQSLAKIDIAVVNLCCAKGLPGAENLDVPACLRTLDAWTEGVRRFVRDSIGDYQRSPDEYGRQRGFFKFLSMASLLKHPRGGVELRYQPTAAGNTRMLDSRDDLIHGLLTRRLGTCASFPVLFVAIGRRLGWPITSRHRDRSRAVPVGE